MTFILELAAKSVILAGIYLIGRHFAARFGATFSHMFARVFFALLLFMPVSTALPGFELSMLPSFESGPTTTTALGQGIKLAREYQRTNFPSQQFAGDIDPVPGRLSFSASADRLATVDVVMPGYAVGAGLAALYFFLGYLTMWRILREGKRVESKGIRQPLERICQALGIKRRIDVMETEHTLVPLAGGLFRPYILLPAGWVTWSDRERELHLLHEAHHIQQRDYVWNMAVVIGCVLNWFNPLVWIAAAAYRAQRERSIDERVVADGVPASEYANHLVSTAAAMGNIQWRTEAIAVSSSNSIKDRIVHILNAHKERRFERMTVRAAFAGLFICIAVLTMAVDFYHVPGADPAPTETIVTHADVLLYKEAVSNSKEGSWQRAFEAYQNLLESYPRAHLLLKRSAFAAAQSGDVKEAVRIYRSLLTLRPESHTYYLRGIAHVYLMTADKQLGYHYLFKAFSAEDFYLGWFDHAQSDYINESQYLKLVDKWRDGDVRALAEEFLLADEPQMRAFQLPEPTISDIDSQLLACALRNADHAQREYAVDLLGGGLPSRERTMALLDVLRIEHDPDVIQIAVKTLAAVSGDTAGKLLEELCLESSNPWVLTYAADMLVRFNPEQAAKYLLSATFTVIDHECHEDAIRAMNDLPTGQREESLQYVSTHHPSESLRAYARSLLETVAAEE